MATTVTDAPIELQRNEQALLGAAFALKLNKLGGKVVILACSGTHLHVLYQSPGGDALAELGRAKQYASYRMAHRPGGLWAGGGKVVRVRSIDQAERTFDYIDRHGPREGAWVWRIDHDATPTRATLDALEQALRAEAGSDDRVEARSDDHREEDRD